MFLLRNLRKLMCVYIPEKYKPLDYKHQDYTNDGNDIQWEDTCEFTLPIQGGRVIKVYDADTMTIAAKIPFKKGSNKDNLLYRFSVRLNGIDAPEMKGKGITEEEKAAAYGAQQFVSNLILNKYVTLKNVSNEKYGRILADVYIGDIHLNELLLSKHYVVPYDGGTKKKPFSWVKYKMTGEMD
jgi:endonuclease YncB( thermonuclease family)